MALIKCPECGKEISDKSKACIHCGYPLGNIVYNEIKYKVVLTSVDNRIICTKRIPEVLSEYDDVKQLVRIISDLPKPYTLRSNLTREEADEIQDRLHEFGAHTNILEMNQSFDVINDKQLQCPKCNSTQVMIGPRGFSLITGFIGSNKTVNRCGKCGYTWKPK